MYIKTYVNNKTIKIFMKQYMKQFSIALLAILLVLSAIPEANAANLTSYRVDAFVNAEGTVHSVVTLEFDVPVSHLEYKLNFKIFNLIARSSYDLTDCKVLEGQDASTVSCDFIGIPSSNILRLDFDSVGVIKQTEDKYQLSIDYRISIPTNKKIISIRLPEGGGLAETNTSYFPKDGEVFTDGRRIGITWKSENSTEASQFLILYTLPPQFLNGEFIIIIIAVIIAIVVLSLVYFLYLRKAMVFRKAEIFKTVLNQDEKKIVDILMKNQGKVYQKVLVRDTDFSKAKVSRLVKGLKDRGVIDIEPVSGRENRVILKLEEKKERQDKTQKE